MDIIVHIALHYTILHNDINILHKFAGRGEVLIVVVQERYSV